MAELLSMLRILCFVCTAVARWDLLHERNFRLVSTSHVLKPGIGKDNAELWFEKPPYVGLQVCKIKTKHPDHGSIQWLDLNPAASGEERQSWVSSSSLWVRAWLQFRFCLFERTFHQRSILYILKADFLFPSRFPCTFKPFSCRKLEAVKVTMLKFMMDPASLLLF